MKKFKKSSGQAVIELAIFGAIVIFLVGTIIRTHFSNTQAQNHQIKAMKLALLQSFQGYNAGNSSHNSATVLFIEDRFSPDVTKFGTLERTPFIASSSATMSNRLMYPIDNGEVQSNLPIMDVYINGQHFPLTTAAFVFRPVYQPSQTCPDDSIETVNGNPVYGPEHFNCLRQKNEWKNGSPLFFSKMVNGTVQFCVGDHPADTCNSNALTTAQSFHLNRDGNYLSNPNIQGLNDPAPSLYKQMAWQWYAVLGDSSHVENDNPPQTPQPPDGKINFGKDQPTYPSLDIDSSLHEQVIYQITYKDSAGLNTILNNPALAPYKINGMFLSLTQQLYNTKNISDIINGLWVNNPGPSGGPITGAAVLDGQLGDIDLYYDSKNPQGQPQPGLLPQQMQIFTWVGQGPSKGGTYLEIREGKLYNPENKVVRSVQRSDHVDLISHLIQLSNNTQRFCQLGQSSSKGCFARPEGTYCPVLLLDTGEANPVQVCGDCNGQNFSVTCFEPASRILYVRSSIGNVQTRKWFTDVTKGL